MTYELRYILRGSLQLLACILVLCGAAYGAPPTGQDLVAALHSGGYVILMRHATSPRTPPEPAQANRDNSQHERQLDESGRRGAWLRAKVAVRPPRGTNTIIVTHFPNVSEAFPDDAKGLEDGEAVIFHPDSHGGASLVARVKINEWARMAPAP